MYFILSFVSDSASPSPQKADGLKPTQFCDKSLPEELKTEG
jgi:hypothetical protein